MKGVAFLSCVTLANGQAAGTASTTPGKCAPVMPGIGCSGGDINGGQHQNVSSAEACCDLCSQHSDCQAWTHGLGHPHSYDRLGCQLKWWCPFMVEDENQGVVSGMMEEAKAPAPTCAVYADPGISYLCQGEDVGNHHTQTTGECCDLCMRTEGCLVYSWQASSQTCFLKKNCPKRTMDGDFTTGWVPPPSRATAARYQVGRGVYELDGYQCGGGSGMTVLFYPKGPGPFNVVVYGHGAWGHIDGLDDWLETVASLGLIVVAPFQGLDPHPCNSTFADDLLNALAGSKKGGASLHPALATADWSRTGVMGHSRGAKYVPLAASNGITSHNVAAIVVSCYVPSMEGVPQHYSHEVPSMFTTGTLDKFNPDEDMRKYYEASKARSKVYVNLMDAYHMEVLEGKRLNVLTAQFLSCHVGNNTEDCKVIYGKGPDSICEVNDYKDCMVTGHAIGATTRYDHSNFTASGLSVPSALPLVMVV